MTDESPFPSVRPQGVSNMKFARPLPHFFLLAGAASSCLLSGCFGQSGGTDKPVVAVQLASVGEGEKKAEAPKDEEPEAEEKTAKEAKEEPKAEKPAAKEDEA